MKISINNPQNIKFLDLSRNPKPLNAFLNPFFSEANIEQVSKSELKKLTAWALLKATRKINSDVFVIAVDDFDSIQDEMLLTLLGVMSSAHKFMFLEMQSGKLKQITLSWFLFGKLPVLIFDFLSTLLFVGVFVGITLVLRGLVNLRQRAIKRHYGIAGDFKRVAYLKTDMALNVKAGGSITHTRGVINGFKDNGKAIYVLSNESVEWLSFPDIKVKALKRTRLFSFFRETERMVNGLVFAFRAIPELRRFKPDVIYQRQCTFDFSGLILSLWFSIPLVLESNASDVRGLYWDRLRFKWICALTERTLMLGSSVTVCVSEPLREILAGLKYPISRIHVLYNGVDIDRFNTAEQRQRAPALRAKLGISVDDMIVGFVGTFGQWHGIPILVEAMIASLKENNRLIYVLIGDGELKLGAQHQINEAGYEDRVIFTGLLAPNEVGVYLAACDILVSPHSRSIDGGKFFGSPTKLFEYMAACKAIVASDLEQIGEILEDGRTALLVEPNNVAALASAINRLARDDALRDRLAESARTEVVKKYTWKQNVGQVISLLKPNT